MVIQEKYCFMVEQNNKKSNKTVTSSLKNHFTNHGIFEEIINSKKKGHSKDFFFTCTKKTKPSNQCKNTDFINYTYWQQAFIN
jgi:hypothetical protein